MRVSLRRRAAMLGATALCALAAPAAAEAPFDVLIRGGTVYDGTGQAGVAADVGVRGGRIVFVGRADGRRARETVDARGLAVAPGFIDAHNHVLEAVNDVPGPFRAEQMLTQGVTTVLLGPDGEYSPAELRALTAPLRAKGSGVNYACYVGHNGVRRAVMGASHDRATPAQIEAMKALVREGMAMGCVGLSTGLMFEPGMFGDTAEVIALAGEVRPFDGTYDSHTRDPVKQMIASEAEAIEIGRAAGIPAKLGHLKAVGLENRGRIGEVIALVEAARARGEEVVADQYPYDGAYADSLKEVFVLPGVDSDLPNDPAAVRAALLAAKADPAARARLKADTENGIDGGFSWPKAVGWGSMRIVHAPGRPELIGRNILLYARELGEEPFDLVSRLTLESDGAIMITLGSIEESDVQALLRRPWVMVASDGAYLGPHEKSAEAHPRSTGTFPRVLGRYARDFAVLSLAEAVRRMTGLPADHLRLRDRGLLKPGYRADITVFDPAAIGDRSTFVDPRALSVGVRYVYVDGRTALREGNLVGKTWGRFAPRANKAP